MKIASGLAFGHLECQNARPDAIFKDKLTKELDDILQVLMAMTLGPEFLYSEKQLCFLSERLISEDSDALNKMCQLG